MNATPFFNMLSPASKEAVLKIRPGNFSSNAKYALGMVKALSSKQIAQIEFPECIFRGGNCGSIEDFASFKEQEKKTREKFLKDVKKIKNAPKIVFTKTTAEDVLLSRVNSNERLPFCGSPEMVFEKQIIGLARRLLAINCKKDVLGLSGWLDSTLALLVIYETFKLLKFDLKNISVYTMPGFGTTKRTKGNADALCAALGIDIKTVNITPACKQHFSDIGHNTKNHDITYENTQARERTQILMDTANMVGGIVIGTGDMSEIALGWSTYNGDHMSMFAVNSGVPKTVVQEICSWYAMRAEEDDKKLSKTLFDIVATPISPVLLPANGNKILQKTEERVGPYELHDFFMWHLIGEKKSSKQVLKEAKKVFKKIYSVATIKKWLDVFIHRFFTQSFKRNCAPDGIKIFNIYFGPFDFYIPSDIFTQKM